jgi:small nuclear ribonucleoprotein (snRNP)-like protein
MSTVLDKISGEEKERKWDKDKKHDKHQFKPGSEKFLNDLVNKVVSCETLSGKTTTGILMSYDTYTLLVVDPKELKNPNPKRTILFKHGLMSLSEA